jgi:hypothetical protein
VFDMMEPERPKVDRSVLEFLKSELLHPVDSPNLPFVFDGLRSATIPRRGVYRDLQRPHVVSCADRGARDKR